MWQHVSRAVAESDMHVATSEKHKLEELQRTQAKQRRIDGTEWKPKLFTQDQMSNKWIYIHAE